MPIPQLPYRQVHLDFHTSEWCRSVGADFDPDAFADTLVAARVNSINLFAKCHHGYSYYPTQVGTPHPHLHGDLLGGQIAALHRRGIRCPIYVSVMWDELAARTHPEWVMIDRTGRQINRSPLGSEWGWATLDVSSGYADYLIAQVGELLRLYDVDGIWLDICFALPNYSPWAKAQMQQAGVDAGDEAAVWRFARKRQTDFMARMTDFIHSQRPDALIFYNGTMNGEMRRVLPYLTHLELESLPTTGIWGYLHYPLLARQARTYGRDFLGMTGRFHTSWGDFGGLKTRDQLTYECGTILAAGGKVCIGDQLHPGGTLDPAVYRLIGDVYRQVEALEPWLIGAQPAREVALLLAEPPHIADPGIGGYPHDLEGAAQMLLELGIQFDVVDTEADLSPYATVFIPDGAPPDAALLARLSAYLAAGGRLVLSGGALLDADGRFALDALPIRYGGPAPTVPAYLRPDAALTEAAGGELADDYDYVFYERAHIVQPTDGAQAHGQLKRALFNRTWAQFMGHQHAPVGDALDAPLIVQGAQVLYFAAPLFSAYRQHDYWAYRALAAGALRRFMPAPRLQPDAPGWVEFALHDQPAADSRPARQIVHIVAYHARRSFQNIAHVDQGGQTAGLSFSLAMTQPPRRVYRAPDDGDPARDLPFTFADGRVRVALPPLGVHSVVVVE